jgi:hypothetical protein
MPKLESEFLVEKINAVKKELADINPVFEAYRRDVNAQLNDLLRKAGIFDEYARLTNLVDAARQKLQSRADQLSAMLASYEQIYAEFHTKTSDAPKVAKPFPDDEKLLDDDSDEWPLDHSDEVEE